jgi:hypothetical protein
MPKRTLAVCVALLVLSIPARGRAEESTVGDRPSTTPKNLPIELKVVNRAADEYELNTSGDRVPKYQERIRLGESNGWLLAASQVDMELVITNTGPRPLQIWVGGDGTELGLELRGNGAMRAEDRSNSLGGPAAPPEVVSIAPGKSHSVPLTSLNFGPRDRVKRAYITETGVYRLSATLRTAVSPAPKGSVPVKGTKFGEVQLHSAPITFRVVRPS